MKRYAATHRWAYLPKPVNGKHGESKHSRSKYFSTLRRCPECRKPMTTDGEGKFWSDCGYYDRQDISNLADLRYKMPNNTKLGGKLLFAKGSG